MSGRFPGGANTPDQLWELLQAGKDGVGEAKGDRWDLGWHHPDPNREERVYTRAGGYLDSIDTFDAEFFGISPKEARQVDPQHRLLLELAWEAMEDANLAPRRQAGTDMGVFIGISGNDYANLVGPQGPDAYSNTGSSLSIAANRISYIFDLHGPSVALDTACSSSLVCVHQASMSLLAGECTTALAGGVNLLVHVRPWLGFSKASMLSPTGRCKSFDASGDGYVRSEGGGLVLLKPLEAAERDGDRILGVILASGVNSDGRTLGLSMPNGDAQERLLRKVYGQCGLKAEDIYYVEAHGTGTSVGDPIECGALGRVLGSPREDGSTCFIGSVKSNIGHLEAASGIAGLTKVLLSLKHRVIPGNLHFDTPNPKIDFETWKLDVVSKPIPIPDSDTPVIIGVNSFGFGGTNAHIIVQEYRAPQTLEGASVQSVSGENVLVLSGHSQAALMAVAQSYVTFLREETDTPWKDVCAAAATTRSMQRTRLALSATSADEAVAKLESYIAGKPTPGLAAGSASALVVPLAFVFSGNGPQWWGMGRELLAENKLFRSEIELIDSIFAPLAGWSLIQEMGKPQAESRVALTEYAQPLLFALQLGLVKVLESKGVIPSAVVGHSVGEVAAAFASGALTLEEATRVIYLRSKAQSRTAGSGKMAALGVSVTAAMEEIAAIDGWLEVAAENAPEAVTVAGDPEALEQLIGSLTEKGKFARLLQLNYPFHTKAMELIREELLDGLAGLSPAQSVIPFISTVTGESLDGDQLHAEYWYRNVRERVEFSGAIGSLLTDLHAGVFLEIGPHPVLKEYVQQIAKADGASAVSLQSLRRPSPKGAEPEADNLWTAICACYANGAVDVAKVFAKPAQAPGLPLYPWQRIQHWRGSVVLPDIDHHTHRDHPLLGYQMTTGEGIWENTVDVNQLSYLRDHVVQRSVVFPAAGYIEMAFSAAQRTLGYGTLIVEDIEIQRPLTIPDHGDPLIQFSVDSATGNFEVRSRAEAYSRDWIRHVRGRVSRNEFSSGAPLADLSEIAERMSVEVDAAAHYAITASRGLEYGPGFQGVAKFQMTASDAVSREALVTIQLPAELTKNLSSYRSHPTLFDACLQSIITLIDQNESRKSALIPVRFDRILSHAPLPETVICHVQLLQESERSALVDFHLMDTAGNLLLEIIGARCQKVDFASGGATPLIASWWKLDTESVGPQVLPALPNPSAILSGVEELLPQIVTDNLRDEYYSLVKPKFDLLARAYIAKAIDVLRRGKSKFDVQSLVEPSASSPSRSTVEHLLAVAAEEGLVERAGSHFTANSDGLPEPALLWKELFEAHPRYQAELMQLAQVGEGLQAINGASQDGPTMTLEPMFDSSTFQLVYNEIARAAVVEMVRSWPKQRPIRVLEIGGGAGDLTSWLLPVLPGIRTDYLFTDPSEAAIGRAEHRFNGHREVRFKALDLENDLVAQGLGRGYFDLVVAGNSLHASQDPAELVERLRSVMASDAMMLIVEAHRSVAVDLMFLHEPAWAGSKPSRLLGEMEWRRLLSEAGFENCSVLSDVTASDGGQQQSVILAQKSGVSRNTAISSQEVSAITPGRMVLVVERAKDAAEETFQAALVSALQEQGCEVDVHAASATGTFQEMWQSNSGPAAVVYLSGASSPDTHGDQLLAEQKNRCLSVLDIVKSLESTRLDSQSTLTLVTRGSFANALGEGPLDPAQAPLWGIGRVISNEHPGLECHLVDLHVESGAVSEAASLLAHELLNRDDETEVQLSAGFRFVNRERLVTLTEEARSPLAKKPDAYMLDFMPQGGLDSLYLRSLKRSEPRSGKVEIAVHAAGLNFRDILWAMGMLPEEAVEEGFSGPTIGMECAGEVVRIGEGVTDVKVGDRVVAFASSCFASHVTTDADSVNVIPTWMNFAEAATIPTAFLTAYYALDHLADIQAGESILIHGAAGGVGIAAVQIAKLKGAKVFGTAGSERKRRMLHLLGVDHVLNSRSLSFADDVMVLTEGKGVDVVLNSLAGEAITRSLKCLKPFGRFLEIGKRDLYANTHLGLRPFRRNLSYFAIDADTLLIERRELARRIFKEVMAHFTSGALKPLPFEAIPISRASEAFRAMQQSRHIGKLLISTELEPTNSLAVVETQTAVKPGVTYVVSGGLGGFGLATAKWLVEQGATALALLSRRGAVTEEAQAGITDLERAGASVKAFAVDISDIDSLTTALKTVRATMPPIGGVIHSAAVIEDAPIMQIGSELLDRVLGPKVVGAWNLHSATLDDPIEMFVLYSSSSTVVGNPGQGAYVAGNLYLDALAQYRRALGLAGLAVGWGAIKDVGFLTRHGNVAEMLRTRTGMDATPSDDALRELSRLSSIGSTRMCVARFDLTRLGRILPGTLVPRFMPIVTPAAASLLSAEETLASRLQQAAPGDRRTMIVESVRDHAAKVLGAGSSQIAIDQPLADLGLDSLMAVELAVAIERDLEKPISVMQLLNASNVNAIADLAMKVLGMERVEARATEVEPEPVLVGQKG
jgi:acyl transferase domain-containing protein/NADPH-dependent curcumin reductase CurA/acyl carrier protein/ubiquinone/menaquinone biosynthesis C-methylase UbiE